MCHNFLNPLKQTAAVLNETETQKQKPRFIVWLYLGISKTNTSSSHLRLLYSSGRVDLGKTQVGADLGLHHLGNPRANTSSGQLQMMSEHHHPAPAQLILHRGQRVVVMVTDNPCS